PGSAREEAVNILIAESSYRDAFNALPVGLSLEERLYGVYRDQLEAVVVTPELRDAAIKRRDFAIPKDLYAETIARAAPPAWLDRENQAATLLANSVHTAVQRALTDPVSLTGR
ncbi:MAG: hypothetical protein ACRDGS_14210, partial [Chloroflexota bacterium]